ncbi:MAG TPA: SPOR domain-containing protein [Methylobacterium sp.]
MTTASRAPVDFDAFERDLQPSAPRPAKGDPLAELARIVGQDDPFRALLEARDSRSPPPAAQQAGRVEPTFVEASAPAQAPYAPGPADAFDQYLASVDQGVQRSGEPVDAAAFADEAAYRNHPAERPRKRNRLVSFAAGLAVLAVSVAGALTWRSLQSGAPAGGVPTILADKAPLKIAPQKADGVEIPDQNKQIYDRTPKDGQIRIVNREEQPIDVAQAARQAPRAGEGGATPGSVAAIASNPPPGTLTESLGEPRRVRTVSVKPDTPPPAPQREATAEPGTATPNSVVPTMVLPGASADGTATTASLRSRPGKPPAALPAPAPAATVEDATPAAVVPAPGPVAKVKPPQRVASVAPDATAALAAPPTVTASTAPTGGFTVQLGVRTSEAEAQAAFRQMQGKYSQLAGQPMLIRQAEVAGKTIYRVRIGPLGKNEATSLCTQLQGAGGQCFVAKN